MSNQSEIYLEGFITLNIQDWTCKADLGRPGTGVYGSGSNEGVYAITDGSTGSYGLKALHGGGSGAIYAQGDVHVMEGKIGIDTQAPSEKLEVRGAIKLGDREDSGADAGTIRWSQDNSKLQVYDGNSWIDLH